MKISCENSLWSWNLKIQIVKMKMQCQGQGKMVIHSVLLTIFGVGVFVPTIFWGKSALCMCTSSPYEYFPPTALENHSPTPDQSDLHVICWKTADEDYIKRVKVFFWDMYMYIYICVYIFIYIYINKYMYVLLTYMHVFFLKNKPKWGTWTCSEFFFNYIKVMAPF